MTPRARTGVVARLGVAQTLAWGSSYYVPAILAGPMARDLGISTATVFGAFSLALVVSAVLGPWAGRRIDRLGGRTTLVGANVVFAAGLCLMAAAQGPVALFAAWALMGVGMAAGLYEAAFATLAGVFGREARGPITGVTLIAGFASTVSWPLSAAMEVEFGWRGACLGWAALNLLVAAPLNLWTPPPAAPPAADAASATVAAPAPAGLSREMVLLALVFAATWIVSTAMAAHLPRLLEAAGATPVAAVAAAALVGPAQVGARLVEFGLLRRFHPLDSARLAALCHPVAAVGLFVLGGPAAAAFALLHGAGNGVLTIAKGTLPLAMFGPAGYGLRQGLLMAPARLGQAVAPLGFAVLIERDGAGAVWWTAGLGGLAVVALLALRREP